MCLCSNTQSSRSGADISETSAVDDPKASPSTIRSKPGKDLSTSISPSLSRAERKHVRYLKCIKKIKKRARSELKNKWSIHNYAERASAFLLPSRNNQEDGSTSVPVLDGGKLSFAEFSHHIEKNNQPCLIKNLIQHWPATKSWTTSAAIKSVIPKDYGCKVGSDDDGYAVRIPYKTFHRYAHDPDHGLKDDSPLYIFDSNMLKKANLVKDYIVPHLFSEDLLKHAGEERRPPYQWICIGGARSGTGIHVDPLGTSAWNALITGHKRWALFPPGSVPKGVLKPKGVNSAVRWFDVVWPETQKEAWTQNGYPRPIEVWQGPGDTMFVPSGWWHVRLKVEDFFLAPPTAPTHTSTSHTYMLQVVVNLDFTVAVTHNFCSSSNFALVFRHTRVSRPKMSLRWLEGLRVSRPDLYAIGRGIVERGELCSDASSPSSDSTSSDSTSSDSTSSDSAM
jgi:histone arginine demethylase JMJD6